MFMVFRIWSVDVLQTFAIWQLLLLSGNPRVLQGLLQHSAPQQYHSHLKHKEYMYVAQLTRTEQNYFGFLIVKFQEVYVHPLPGFEKAFLNTISNSV